MRNLGIYLSALATLSPALGVKHGAAQFRDLLAYPKYDVQFLNDLPISSGDAGRAETLGVETEDEWTRLHLDLHERKRLSDGSDVVPDAVGGPRLPGSSLANGRID
jgi:protein OS-9